MPPDVLVGQQSPGAETPQDPELSGWLGLHGADQESIERVGPPVLSWVPRQCNVQYLNLPLDVSIKT